MLKVFLYGQSFMIVIGWHGERIVIADRVTVKQSTSMTRLLIALIFLSILPAQGLVLHSADALSRAAEHPPFALPPWAEGCVGIDHNGAALGESNRAVAVWKVGPNAVVWSRHVNPQPSARVDDVRHGTTHALTSVVPLGSDVVLGIVEQPFRTWGAVWDDYRVSTNQAVRWWTNPATGAGFPFPYERVDATSISNLQCAIITGGPGAILRTSDGCISGIAEEFKRRWASASGITLTTPQPDLWIQRIARNENPEFLLAGPQAQIPFAADDAPSNPGFITGDSGGGVFVRGIDGKWRLLGLLVSGAQCRGGIAVASIVSQSAFLREDHWRSIGQMDKWTRYRPLKAHLAADPTWEDTVPTPSLPTPSPQAPPSTTAQVVVTVTNFVTVTNYVTRLKPSQIDALEQFAEWASRASEAVKGIEPWLRTNSVAR